MKKILVVEDDRSQRKAISRILHSYNFRVEEAASGEEALERIQASHCDLVLIDHIMPGMSGMDALITIKKLEPKIKVIVMTGFASIDDAIDATKKGASNYLSKPLDTDKLIISIRRALEESKFEMCLPSIDLDRTFGSLSHQIRREIIGMLHKHETMHMMQMARSLCIEDHTKVAFHIRNLKQSGFITQGKDKSYFLTDEGKKITTCLKMIEKNHVS